jgi:hypothetical protein
MSTGTEKDQPSKSTAKDKSKSTAKDKSKSTAKDIASPIGEQEDSQTQGPKVGSEQQRNRQSQPQTSYVASIYPINDPHMPPLPPELGEAVQTLEAKMDQPIWLLLQNGIGKYGDINAHVRDAFFFARSTLRKASQNGKKIVLMIDSLGGDAKAAYQLATLFKRYCGGFIAVVPRYAKSAATLLTIGADEVILGRCAELGPLDTQIYSPQRNGYIPVLDKVKALERLHASALDMLDRSVTLMALRSGKDPNELLGRALELSANVTRPLLEKFDVDEYTRMSRYLKRGEDYATRLLEDRFVDVIEIEQDSESSRGIVDDGEQGGAMITEDIYEDYLLAKDSQARLLAQHLVGAYPDHSFAIEIEEATKLLPQVSERYRDDGLLDQLDRIYQILAQQPDKRVMAIGRVAQEETPRARKRLR